MSDLPNNFETLIAAWGIGPFADAIGVSYSTANAMKQRNSVPSKYWAEIVAKAPEKLQLSERRLIDFGTKAGKVAA